MTRRVDHPGPIASDRSHIVQTPGQSLSLTLAPGVPLDQAIAAAMADACCDSAWLEIEDAAVDRLTYVIPAEAPDRDQVAWYSDERHLGGPGRIDRLGMVVGRDSGASFLHGHGLWTPAGGSQAMGHVLAAKTVLAAPAKARGIGLDAARFDRLPDPETHFSLFHPVRTGPELGDHAALRLAPNQDFATALDGAVAQLGWEAAQVHGIGSLIGARFEGGHELSSIPSEFLVTHGTAGDPDAAAEIAIVGTDPADMLRGTLSRGDNPILITAEIILERLT
ncbi:MAG: DUF296 domain-containing protein [Pseudomonadota bacterium]